MTVSSGVGQGWAAFADLELVGQMLGSLLFALLLGAVIAYHPLVRGKASTVAELEQPKTFLVYAMVAAVIAQIVMIRPEMALVVFGIGGLLRFRTDVGEAKDTGRVILVTVVGLCVGMQLFVVAVIATALGWCSIFLLERQVAMRVVIRDLAAAEIVGSARAYKDAARAAGCEVVRERRNFAKSQVSLVLRIPQSVDRDALEQRFDQLPEAAKGIVDWETA